PSSQDKSWTPNVKIIRSPRFILAGRRGNQGWLGIYGIRGLECGLFVVCPEPALHRARGGSYGVDRSFA
ncbi:MAG: hypothetical protein ABFS56_30135, partial [Pseudomonadota bacterium]